LWLATHALNSDTAHASDVASAAQSGDTEAVEGSIAVGETCVVGAVEFDAGNICPLGDTTTPTAAVANEGELTKAAKGAVDPPTAESPAAALVSASSRCTALSAVTARRAARTDFWDRRWRSAKARSLAGSTDKSSARSSASVVGLSA
jgi:hypothetical protein